jgi:hypothetical protein
MMRDFLWFQGARMSIFSRFAPYLCTTFLLTGVVAHSSFADQPPKPKESGKDILAPGPARSNPSDPTAAKSAWTLVIVSFVNEADTAARDEAARLALDKVRRAGLADAVLEQRGKAAVICFGSFASPDDSTAQDELKRVRELEIDNARPFAGAFLAPPLQQGVYGSNPELDLRNAKKRYGGKKATYTLQVAAYGKSDRTAPTESELKEFRAAAEKAAGEYRREGELAFYYHGPNSSSVTIGVYSPDDINPRSAKGLSPQLRQARERHPNHLLNGAGVKERSGGEVGKDGKPVFKMQTPMLVEIPER